MLRERQGFLGSIREDWETARNGQRALGMSENNLTGQNVVF